MRRAAACAITFVVLTGCGSEVAGGSGEEPSGSWEQLPSGPLGPREHAVAVGLGDRVLVVGGSDAAPCPPAAECVIPDEPSLSDGAIYDRGAGQWQRIADAPVPVEWAQTAVVGAAVYMWVSDNRRPDSREAFLRYDIGDDEWTELPLPPDSDVDYCCAVTAAGDQVVAYPGSDELGENPDHVFDPSTGEWSELPADPLSPTFDRVMVWSGTELILFAQEALELREPAEPGVSLVAALDIEAGAWRRLPDTGSLSGGGVLVGGRIVNPVLGWADGGEVNNWGEEYPYGGILEPDSGEWSELPNAPDGENDFSAGLYADGQAHYLDDHGWVLDLEDGEWGWIGARPGTSDGRDGPISRGAGVAAIGESLFVHGGVNWDDWGPDAESELLAEAWLWTP